MNEKVRQSNFELMRLVSMFFIVIYHMLIHTGVVGLSHGFTTTLFRFIECIILVHVNSFVLLTGYFQVDSKFNIKKVFSLNNADWFYRVFYFIIFYFLFKYSNGYFTFLSDSVEKVRMLSPIDHGVYWFLNIYLILYLLSPVFNLAISRLDQRKFIKVLLVLVLVFMLFPLIVNTSEFLVADGRSVYAFIVMYFIGAYLKKYPLDRAFFLKKLSLNAQKIIYIFVFFMCALLATSCLLLIPVLSNDPLSRIISGILSKLHDSYLSPIVVLQTIAYFMFFKSLNFKSKIINSFSKYLFGIYLVHENVFVRDNLIRILKFWQFGNLNIGLIGVILLLSIIVFIISFIVEFIRQKIFKFIYNRKICRKISNKFYSYIKGIRFV